MTSTGTRLPAPSQGRERTGPRLAVVPAAVAVTAFLAAAAASVFFFPWVDRYDGIYFQAVETSTTARYPQGFLVTGVLEGTALVLMTATALLAVAAAIAGDRVQAVRADARALLAIAALLAAMVLPVAALDGFFAIVPVLAAGAAAGHARQARPGTATIGVVELAGWGAAIIAAETLIPGLGIIVAVVLAFTRLRHAGSAQRWGTGYFSLLVALVHLLFIA